MVNISILNAAERSRIRTEKRPLDLVMKSWRKQFHLSGGLEVRRRELIANRWWYEMYTNI